MTSKKYYRTCFVSNCESTTIKTAFKHFFCVPTNFEVRKKWFTQAHRTDQPARQCNYSCCEDHFNVSISKISEINK